MTCPYRKLLKKMDVYLEKTARKATDSPVYLKVSSFKDRTEVARLVRYTKPTEYEVVFSKQKIDECRKKGPVCEREMKQVISHELAHINHPDIHSAAFRTECHRLGGGNRCVARGIERRRK
jgi:hypothetical protein